MSTNTVKTPTDDVYAAVTGITCTSQIRPGDPRLRPDGAAYVGDGVWVRPDGTINADQ